MTKISPYTALCDMFLKKSNENEKNVNFHEKSAMKISNSCQTQPMRDYSVDKIINALRDSKRNATESHNINIFHDDNFEILRPDYAAYSGSIHLDSNPVRNQKLKFIAEKPHEDVFPKFAKLFNYKKSGRTDSSSKINECTMTDLGRKVINTTCSKPHTPDSHQDMNYISNKIQVNALYKTVSNFKSAMQENYDCSSNEKCLCDHCGAIAVVNESLKRPQFLGYEAEEPRKPRKHKKRSSDRDYYKLLMKLKQMEERINELEDIPSHKYEQDDEEDSCSDCNEEKPKLIFPENPKSSSPNRFNPKNCPFSFGFSPNNIKAKFFKKRPPCGDICDDDDDDDDDDYKIKQINKEPIKEPRRESTRETSREHSQLKPTLRSFGYMYKKTERNLTSRQGTAAFCETKHSKIEECNQNYEKPINSTANRNLFSNKIQDLLFDFRRKNNETSDKNELKKLNKNKIEKKNGNYNKTEDNLIKSSINKRIKMNVKEIQTHTSNEESFKVLHIIEPINSPNILFSKSSNNFTDSNQVYTYVNDNYESKTDLSNSSSFSFIPDYIKNKPISKKININDKILISSEKEKISNKKTKLGNSSRIKPNQKCKLSESEFNNMKIKNNEYYLSHELEDLTKSDKEHIINRLSKISTSKETIQSNKNKNSKQCNLKNKKNAYQVWKSNNNKSPTYKISQRSPAIKNPMFFRSPEISCKSSILLNEYKTNKELELIRPLMVEKSTELSAENIKDMYGRYGKRKTDFIKQTLLTNNIEPLFQNNDSNSLKNIIIFNQPHYSVPYRDENVNNRNNRRNMHAKISQEATPLSRNKPYTPPIIAFKAQIKSKETDSKKCVSSPTESKSSNDNIRSYTVMKNNSSSQVKRLKKIKCHKCKNDSDTDKKECKFNQNKSKTTSNSSSKVSVCSRNSSKNNSMRSRSQCPGEVKHSQKVNCGKCKNDHDYDENKCRLDHNQFQQNKCKNKKNTFDDDKMVIKLDDNQVKQNKCKSKKNTFDDDKMVIKTECKLQPQKCNVKIMDRDSTSNTSVKIVEECTSKNNVTMVDVKSSTNNSVTIIDGEYTSNRINKTGILTKVLLYCTSSTQFSAASKENCSKLQCEKDTKKINYLRNQIEIISPMRYSETDSTSSISIYASLNNTCPKKKCFSCASNQFNKSAQYDESLNLVQSSIIDGIQIKSIDEICSGNCNKLQLHSCQSVLNKSSLYKPSAQSTVSIETVEIKSRDNLSSAKCNMSEMHTCKLAHNKSLRCRTEDHANSKEQCLLKTHSLHNVKLAERSVSNKRILIKDKKDISGGKCNNCEMQQINSNIFEELNTKYANSKNSNSNLICKKSSPSCSTHKIKIEDSMHHINKSTCNFNCMKTITSKFNCKYFKNLYGRKNRKQPHNYCEFCCGPNKDKYPCKNCMKRTPTVDIYFNVQGQNSDDNDSDSDNSDDDMILTANEKRKYLLEKLHLLQNYRDLIISTEKSNYGEFE